MDYKVIYEKAAAAINAGEYKLVYEKNGNIYGSASGVPADNDYCFNILDKMPNADSATAEMTNKDDTTVSAAGINKEDAEAEAEHAATEEPESTKEAVEMEVEQSTDEEERVASVEEAPVATRARRSRKQAEPEAHVAEEPVIVEE